MTDGVNHKNPYEAAAAPLKEKRARLAAELDAVCRSLTALDAASIAAGFTPVSSSGDLPPRVNVEVTSVFTDKFKGMGLEEAAAKCLSESDRMEMTAKQIWASLSSSGFTLLSDRPEQSVSWALRKREKKGKDVILVGDGKWGMVKWYSQARLRELHASRNNASTRNSAEHIAKTKAGIANAKETRLSRWGRRPSVKQDQMAKAYYARKSGDAKSKLAMARAGGIVYPTFLSYWCTYEMENWKPGDPLPPKRRDVPKVNQDFKIEDMWPPEDGQADLLKGNGIVVGTTTPH